MAEASIVPPMAKRSPGRPTLSPTEAQHVREGMLRLLAERYRGNKTALGVALGISQPAVTLLLDEVNRPSLETAKRVALQEGRPLGDYLDEGDHAFLDPRYPSKDRAAHAAFAVELPSHAVKRMLEEDPPELAGRDPGPMFWLKRVEGFASLPDPRPPALPAAPVDRPGKARRRAK